MKKFKRLGALFVALCMLLSMTAFAAGATGAIVLTIGAAKSLLRQWYGKTITRRLPCEPVQGKHDASAPLRGGEYGRYRVMECFYKANCHEV